MERERRIEILTQVRDSSTVCDATEDEITLLRVRDLISGPNAIRTVGVVGTGKLHHLPASEGQTPKYFITGKGLEDIKGDDGETTNP